MTLLGNKISNASKHSFAVFLVHLKLRKRRNEDYMEVGENVRIIL